MPFLKKKKGMCFLKELFKKTRGIHHHHQGLFKIPFGCVFTGFLERQETQLSQDMFKYLPP